MTSYVKSLVGTVYDILLIKSLFYVLGSAGLCNMVKQVITVTQATTSGIQQSAYSCQI